MIPQLGRGGEGTDLQLLCAEMPDEVKRFYAIK